MMMWMNIKTWHKNALFFKAHTLAFFDSNNNGISDLRGITETLEQIPKQSTYWCRTAVTFYAINLSRNIIL